MTPRCDYLFIRFLDCDRISLDRSIIIVDLILWSIYVEFEYVSSCNLLCVSEIRVFVKLVHVDSVLVYFDLLAEIVATQMLVVQIQLHELSSRSPFHDSSSNFECNIISHEGPVHPVGKQYPSLVLRHSEYFSLAVKFKCIWLLRIPPGAVSSTSDACCCVKVLVSFLIINLDAGAFSPLCLACYAYCTRCVYIYFRKGNLVSCMYYNSVRGDVDNLTIVLHGRYCEL